MENRKGGNFSVSNSEALTTTLRNAIQALGRGFDVTSDVRLLYCKGAPGSRLVRIEEGQNRDLELSDGDLLPNVPADIECSRGRNSMQRIPVCSFHQVDFRRIFFVTFPQFFVANDVEMPLLDLTQFLSLS